MKYKIIITLSVAMLFVSTIKAQLDINSYGMVHITANTSDWWSGLKVTVPTYNSCAYHLNYGGRDRFFVHASGYLWCERGGYFGSDSTLKENITKLESPLKKLKKINGYEYNYKNDFKKGTKTTGYIKNEQKIERRLGLLAQEVEQVFPGVVKTMPDSTKAISYTDLTALLIESIKEQQVQIETLQTIVYSQEQEMIKLKKTIENCCTNNDKSKLKSATISNETTSINETISETAKLFDNTPNPFSLNTEIKFEIPEKSTSARLIIHDLQGIEIKSLLLSDKTF